MADLSYREVDTWFTAFYPNTPAGENAWHVIAAKTDCTGKVLTAHAECTAKQLREAGYTVVKAAASTASDDELLNALAA